MRWLFDHVESRERRRDAAVPRAAVEGAAARRDLRLAAWGRAFTLLGALGLLVVLGVGPAPDTAALASIFAVSVAALLGGVTVWVVGAARLSRRELAVRVAEGDRVRRDRG